VYTSFQVATSPEILFNRSEEKKSGDLLKRYTQPLKEPSRLLDYCDQIPQAATVPEAVSATMNLSHWSHLVERSDIQVQ